MVVLIWFGCDMANVDASHISSHTLAWPRHQTDDRGHATMLIALLTPGLSAPVSRQPSLRTRINGTSRIVKG